LRLSILSQLLLKSCARSCPPQTATAFQFFPSCCEDLLPRRVELEVEAFNSFPVAASKRALIPSAHASLSILSQLLQGAGVLGASAHLRALSILSQLLRGGRDPRVREGSGGLRGAFNSFPVAARRGRGRGRRARAPSFQFFPSCCTKNSGSAPSALCLPPLSILSQLLPTGECARFNRAARRGLSILSQLLPLPLQPQPAPSRSRSFQFFPSCCEITSYALRAAAEAASFNSFPVVAGIAVKAVKWEERIAFNSFPVAAVIMRGDWKVLVVWLIFQFFPSCCWCTTAAATIPRYALSILSQLLLRKTPRCGSL